MADENRLSIDIVCSAMPRSLEALFVALKEKRTTTIKHLTSFSVNVWTVHPFRPSYSYTIVALGPATTIVPRHKKVIPSTMPEYVRGFNGIATSIF